MNIVARAVSEANTGCEITIDSIVRPDMFSAENDHMFTGVQHSRPDICVIDHASKKCKLVEIAVPFDVFLNESYQSKFDTYMPLCQRVSELGYECKTMVLIVGSFGSVHKKFVNGLRFLGLPTHRAKCVGRFCSVSAMVGSRIIWRQRCREVLP
jgi:hypothetical protein